jgi:hypothetical protein
MLPVAAVYWAGLASLPRRRDLDVTEPLFAVPGLEAAAAGREAGVNCARLTSSLRRKDLDVSIPLFAAPGLAAADAAGIEALPLAAAYSD